MSQESEATVNDEMRLEHDFSGGVRGKYYEAYMQSSNVVVLDPDVASNSKFKPEYGLFPLLTRNS